MKQQLKPVPSLRHGLYYTITNCKSGLTLTMPKTNKYLKDKPQFQQHNPNNINQLWMIEQITPNRYQIVHAISTLVLDCVVGSNNCKLQFGKRKPTQLFFVEEDNDIAKMRQIRNRQIKGNQNIRDQANIHKHKDTNHQHQQKMTKQRQRQSNMKPQRIPFTKQSIYKPGQRFVTKVRFKQRENSRRYLFSDLVTKVISTTSEQDKNQKTKKIIQAKVNVLKFMEIDIFSQPQSTLWQIRQVLPNQNQILSKSCYISSYRSNQVLDVPQASDKQGVQIIQYPCNFRFNQKWTFQKVDEVNGYGYYTIMNTKSGLYLDIKGNLAKQDVPIIQWQKNYGKNQIWRLQQQGKRTYLIRSALDKQLLLGVKENSLKQCAEIVTSKVETECFWIIYGNIPQ